MPTFEIVCAECEEVRWPILPERPRRYVCVRCLTLPSDKKARRRAAAAKGRVKRAGGALKKRGSLFLSDGPARNLSEIECKRAAPVKTA